MFITTKLLFLAAGILVITSQAHAAKVEFVKEHTYRAGDMDSKVSSRAIALMEVKRALLEQLGTYLVSETEVRNFQMTKDQISLLTAGIVSAVILDEKWDGKEFCLKAKLVVDPQEVAERVKAMSHDRERTRELEEAKRKRDQALREVERLKKDMGLARPDIQGQMERQADYSRAVQELGTDDWYSGFRFLMKDGSSFIWTNYEESADSYCTRLNAGRICVPMKDVASIKQGAYPENTEVISGKTTDERSRRKAAQEWKATQRDNERTQRTIECRRKLDGLQQLRRDSADYRAQYDDYRKDCSGMKGAPAPTRSESRTSSGPTR
ncbi:MAG: hypothetical protein AABZ15_10605 [Nitrospirota bacterium]